MYCTRRILNIFYCSSDGVLSQEEGVFKENSSEKPYIPCEDKTGFRMDLVKHIELLNTENL